MDGAHRQGLGKGGAQNVRLGDQIPVSPAISRGFGREDASGLRLVSPTPPELGPFSGSLWASVSPLNNEWDVAVFVRCPCLSTSEAWGSIRTGVVSCQSLECSRGQHRAGRVGSEGVSMDIGHLGGTSHSCLASVGRLRGQA